MHPSSSPRQVGAPPDPQPHHLPLPRPERSSVPDQNQTDLISNLPDCVLCSILSLLPIRDAIRTGTLSSRWRNLWKLNPLHFDDSTIKLDNKQGVNQNWLKTLKTISCIASTHPGPIHSFRISQLTGPAFIPKGRAFHPEVDSLMETLTSKGIRELALRFWHRTELRYRLPLSLLQCQTLRKVSLSECFFPPSPVVASSFPNLRELTLERSFIWDDLLRGLLESCAHLEVLQLINCSGLQYIRLNCVKLRELTIRELGDVTGLHLKEVVIEHAPELRSLRLGEGTVDHTRFSVKHVQKLEVLGLFSMNATMQLGNTFSKSSDQDDMFVNGHMGLSTVKELAILVGSGNGLFKCSLLSAVLRCFPCLESLLIKGSIRPPADIGFWEQEAPFGFLERHLKSVTFIEFLGLEIVMELAKYFVQYGQVLERITIVCNGGPMADWKTILHHELHLENRASMHLEVEILHKTDFDPNSCQWASLFDTPL